VNQLHQWLVKHRLFLHMGFYQFIIGIGVFDNKKDDTHNDNTFQQTKNTA